jgi:hypothetical protein
MRGESMKRPVKIPGTDYEGNFTVGNFPGSSWDLQAFGRRFIIKSILAH